MTGSWNSGMPVPQDTARILLEVASMLEAGPSAEFGLVPALHEDLFEELENGSDGEDILEAARAQQAAALRAAAEGAACDLLDLAAGCTWGIRLMPGATGTLAAVRDSAISA